jgi:CubicO group peptidase (beta-lactamase class C family)
MRPTPALVLALAATLALPAAAQPGAPGTAVGLGAELDRYLQRTVPFGFSGSVLVARDGNVLLHRGYGMADTEAGIPSGP